MAGALAIASVTHVLTRLLDQRLIERGVAASLGDVLVSALPPDRVPVGAEERPQLNIFLYRVTPNTRSWSRDTSAEYHGLTAERPLALDLHYLLTAYGERNFQAEMLLGYALECLQQTPALTVDALHAVLGSGATLEGSVALPRALGALSVADVANLVGTIRMTPFSLSMEDMLKLWSALQARYRPSLTYQASAVLVGGVTPPGHTAIEREYEPPAGGSS